jgi:hypothetical protein
MTRTSQNTCTLLSSTLEPCSKVLEEGQSFHDPSAKFNPLLAIAKIISLPTMKSRGLTTRA